MLACDASLCRVNLFSCDFKKTKKNICILIDVCVSGIVGQPGLKRDEWTLRHSASLWGTTEEEVVSAVEASWGLVEAEGDR